MQTTPLSPPGPPASGRRAAGVSPAEPLRSPCVPPALAPRSAAGTLAHAYILTGEDSKALENAAISLAVAMVCTPEEGKTAPCGECKHCRKALKGVHPDVAWVRRPEDKRSILVDQIRWLRSDAYIRPNEARRKVYLIQEAHLMNPEAQNAFLKVLEDGPLYAAFLLLTTAPGALLATIRSRCETVRVDARAAEADGELSRKAGELAGLLLEENNWRLISWCAEHERDKREDAAALLEETRKALLRYRDARTTPRAVEMALLLRELTAQLNRNANVGCVWGRLWAEAGSRR